MLKFAFNKQLLYYIFHDIRHGKATPGSYFGPGTGPVIIDDLDCHGNETDINQCASAPWGASSCGPNNVAGLDCQGNRTVTPLLTNQQ